MTVEQQLQYIIENMVTKVDLDDMATKDDLLSSEKLLLNEMDRLFGYNSQKIEKIIERLDIMQIEINATRFSNETVDILHKKVTELEKRIAELEKTA